MTINVVTVESGWILQKIAERIVAANQTDCEMVLSHKPRNDVDANFYVDIQNCFFGKAKTLDLGFFTHADRNDIRTVSTVTLQLDFIFHQATRYMELFRPYYPHARMEIMYPAPEAALGGPRKPLIGIFQRGGFEGKGHGFMKSLAECYVLTKFRFLFVGTGWEDVVEAYRAKGIDAEQVGDEQHNDYGVLYDTVDYVLIPSLWEGGPMSLIEALAKGVPVIGADVGWVGKDFKADYQFETGNTQALLCMLDRISAEIEDRVRQVSRLSYRTCAEQLVRVVRNLK